jgi:hypothetical protein
MTETLIKLLRSNAERLQKASNDYNGESQGGEPSVAVIDAMRDALDAVAADLWNASEGI